MPTLTRNQRERAIGMRNMGASQAHIARTFNCTPTTIFRLITRLGNTGSTKGRPRSGRPRVTTPPKDRYIRSIHLRNRFVTATSTAATALGHRIRRRTVSRSLHIAGIRAYPPFRGMVLILRHRQNSGHSQGVSYLNYLQRKKVNVLPWPQSDMNPIEHVINHRN